VGRDFISAEATAPLAAEPVVANAAIALQEQARLDEIDARIQLAIGTLIETEEVITRRLTIGERLLVETGGTGQVTIEDGAIEAQHLTTTSAVITNSLQVDNNVIVSGHIDVSTLSAISADLGTITAGVLDLVTGTTGIHIEPTQILAKVGGVTKLDFDLDAGVYYMAGEIVASKITVLSNAANDVQFGADVIIDGDVYMQTPGLDGSQVIYFRHDANNVEAYFEDAKLAYVNADGSLVLQNHWGDIYITSEANYGAAQGPGGDLYLGAEDQVHVTGPGGLQIQSAAGILSGSGAPDAALGSTGWIYLSDGGSLYFKQAAGWRRIDNWVD
jgi:hypothetical protein